MNIDMYMLSPTPSSNIIIFTMDMSKLFTFICLKGLACIRLKVNPSQKTAKNYHEPWIIMYAK